MVCNFQQLWKKLWSYWHCHFWQSKWLLRYQRNWPLVQPHSNPQSLTKSAAGPWSTLPYRIHNFEPVLCWEVGPDRQRLVGKCRLPALSAPGRMWWVWSGWRWPPPGTPAAGSGRCRAAGGGGQTQPLLDDLAPPWVHPCEISFSFKFVQTGLF